MGACFSRQQKNEVPYTRYIPNKRITNHKKQCFFGLNCTRQNEKHWNEFSHDKFDPNHTRASKAESCKKYHDSSVSQSHLGGGSAGMVQQPESHLDERHVKNAGLALFTSDDLIVLVIESTGLNFPSGKRNHYEPALGCAIREAKEEFGFINNQTVLNVFDRGLSTNLLTFVKKHGNSSQTVIYLFRHEQSSDWFNSNFRPNSECSAIVMMSIPDFIRNVEQSPYIFRFPESMRQFVAQLKTTISI